MGAGASSIGGPPVSDKQLTDAIKKVEQRKAGAKLDGEAVEEAVGHDLFDCNAFDVLSKPDNSAKGQGIHKVSREDLLMTLRVHQVVRNSAAKPSRTPASELEQLERAQRERVDLLRAKRPPQDAFEARGALVGAPGANYLPLQPADANSKTITYPYAAAAVLLYRHRDTDGGWDLGLWRSRVTGEWGTIYGNYAGRHDASAARPHALRMAAAEALCEQSCGLLRVAPGCGPAVLRDAASVSVVWDGGPPLDFDARPRQLVQVFAVRVDGLLAEDLHANRDAVARNIGAGPQPQKPWLEFDDLTWTPLELVGLPGGRSSVTDVEGRVCGCRKLVDLLGRPLVASPLTPPADGVRAETHGGVLGELTAKLGKELGLVRSPVSCAGDAGPAGGAQASAPPQHNESRWFAPSSAGGSGAPADDDTGPAATILTRHSELSGGLLAGASTAALSTISSVVTRSKLW